MPRCMCAVRVGRGVRMASLTSFFGRGTSSFLELYTNKLLYAKTPPILEISWLREVVGTFECFFLWLVETRKRRDRCIFLPQNTCTKR